MKRQNRLESLDEQLRMMPKPHLNKSTALQIKQTILNTRVTQATQKKKRNLKAISATIGSLAAALLFAVLMFGNVGQDQPQATLTFSDLVEGDIIKIDGVNDEKHYSTEESPIIELFYETVGSIELTESNAENLNGLEEEMKLYDKDGELLQVLQFSSNSELVSIDGKLYEVESSKWLDFKEKFFTEDYLITLEDEEEKPNVSTDDIAGLLNDELAKAPSERNWDNIFDYIKQGANPDKALMIAAKENKDSIVAQLLQLNADPNTTDGSQNTPLTLTTSTEVASLLLETGANIDHRNARDYNALVIAVYGHQTEMVKLLLEAGANPNTTVNSNSDVTVLWMAGKSGNEAISDLLLQHGANTKEGYDLENWMFSQIPSLSDMLDQNHNLFSFADIGRLPNLLAIQVPADSTSFTGQFEEPFESYKVEGGTADVYGDNIFIKQDDNNLYSVYRYELNPGDNVTVADIENALNAPSSSFMNETGDMIMSYNLNYYELRFTYDGTVNYPKDETEILALELHYKQPGIIEHADTVFNLLAENKMEELSSHVHPEKGVLIAPFLQVKSNFLSENHEPLIFKAEEIPNLLQDTTVYRWGDNGASGLPIELTPADFFDRYLYTKAQPDTFFVNQQNLSGPEFFTEIIRDEFPGAHMVQYTFYETVEGDDLSWMQLTLIFEEYQGEWKLVGMLHREWTP